MNNSRAVKSSSRAVLSCVTLLGVTLLGNVSKASSETPGCTVLEWDKKLVGFPYLPIRAPGKYCIDRDYLLSCSEALGTCGSGPNTPFVDIRASNVELDLRGHTLSRSGRQLTISAVGRNIAIQNGTIQNGSLFMDTPDARGAPINSNWPAAEPRFESTGYMKVENLKIEGGSINVTGANVIIRDNTVIEKDADYYAAVAIYGPQPVVSGNVIIRNTSAPFRSKDRPHGIYLRYANGGIVKDNTIENRGFRTNSVAVGLRNRQAVQIENNTIINFSSELERVGKSEALVKGNVVR